MSNNINLTEQSSSSILQASQLAGKQKRNLAYRRAAYQSSSYTVNETAQLVTVGLEPMDESKMAYEFLHKNGNQSRYGNVKYLFDYNHDTEFHTYTTSTWVQVRLPRKTMLCSYAIKAGSCCGDTSPFPSTWVLQGSMDGIMFEVLDCQVEQEFVEHEEKVYYVNNPSKSYTHYRLNIEQVMSGDRIHIAAWALKDGNGCDLLATYDANVLSYVSAWMSAGNEEEWIYVDLGDESIFDRVVIHWGSMFATTYEIQVSNDAKTWVTVAEDSDGSGGSKELTFACQQARYVRLFMKETNPQNFAYIVRELEVYSTGDANEVNTDKITEIVNTINTVNTVNTVNAVNTDKVTFIDETCIDRNDIQSLKSNWKIERANSLEAIAGTQIASADYNDSSWLPAKVPGTAFLSYLRAGAVADPTFADWQRCASDSYFKSDFWYRTSFLVSEKKGQNIWLNFDAINWKAKVYLNGTSIGDINGGFIRGKFNITDHVNYGGENYLAVLIVKNTDPGTAYTSNNDGPGTMGGVFGNDGRIGEDAPTYSAANGWDWVPTIRGRNIGIYNEVYLSFTEAVQIIDPWVVTTFDHKEDGTHDLTKVNVTLKTEVSNTSKDAVTTTIRGVIKNKEVSNNQEQIKDKNLIENWDEILFEKEVALKANETCLVDIGPLVMNHPDIWWPNGYGDQPLYDMVVTALIGGVPSDQKEIRFGVREFTYHLEEDEALDRNGYKNGNNLTLACNGVRIIIRGGNWGLEDIHLEVDAQKYDDKIRLHKYENFNIIRNWGGQTNDPELYKACDKYGILIWDDFFFPGCWLHSPKDSAMFLANVHDKIKNYRGHACLALYCGANEMHPEVEVIEKGMREAVALLDGTRHYFPNSAQAPVAEDGPHKAMFPEFYFNHTLPNLMNSERGMPNIPVAETMKLIFPEDQLWPHNDLWALHDFALRWNVDGAGYLKKLEDYGAYDTFDEMMRRAQMQGYELHKALFEGSIASRSHGLMMWMSNPVWPSLVWQSYDYFHDVNGGYYGLKTACQPINLLWNRTNDQMMLFNGTPKDQELTGIINVFDGMGKLLDEKKITLDMAKDSLIEVYQLDFSRYESDLVFIKTRVLHSDGSTAGENFYWHNHRNHRDYKELAKLPYVDVITELKEVNEDWYAEDKFTKIRQKVYQVTVKNESKAPALLIRIKVICKETGERVLPVFYEDNYFSLMPGESKCVNLDFNEKKLLGSTPQIEVEGFNIINKVC